MCSIQYSAMRLLFRSRRALSLLLLGTGPTLANEPITVADASLSVAFYSDSSCLLTIDNSTRLGKTIIDADVDDVGSRMLIHCDTQAGRRLTLLARGDSLDVSNRVPLLTRAEIEEGEFGMIAWLTRSSFHYADDSAPRRYVIAGSVLLRKSPPVQASGNALNSQRHAFGFIDGTLEPLIKPNDPSIYSPLPERDTSELSGEHSLPLEHLPNSEDAAPLDNNTLTSPADTPPAVNNRTSGDQTDAQQVND